MAIPKKGLRDIHTMAGKVDESSVSPHKAYMRLSCLEMEKFRRRKERESAIHRVHAIDARFQEIESEKVMLLQALGEKNCCISADAPSIKSKPPDRHETDRFKIRY
jgi:hypothetical protein